MSKREKIRSRAVSQVVKMDGFVLLKIINYMIKMQINFLKDCPNLR